MATPVGTLEIIRMTIASELGIPPAEVDPSRSIEEIGIDSLAAIEILFKLEDAFHISIPQDLVAGATVAELARRLDERVAERKLHPHLAGVRGEIR